MRLLVASFFMLLCYSSAGAASDEFPEKFRGYWGNSRETCNKLRTTSSVNFQEGERWLKITSTNVLGTTQGRLLRQIPVRMIYQKPAEASFEIQMTDEFGLIVNLDFRDQILSETMMGAHADRHYEMC
jgi:hypothetical protein